MEPATTIDDGRGGRLAILTSPRGEDERPVPDRDELAAALETMPDDTEAVAVVAAARDRHVLLRMARGHRRGILVARGAAVTDALKRVAGDRVAGTLDRSGILALRLPLVTDPVSLASVIRSAPPGPLDLVRALALAAETIIVVDRDGAPHRRSAPS